jgi:hypothetical protein
LKLINFSLTPEGGSATQFECQVRSWQILNNTEDGERHFTFCPDGEFREDADPDYALQFTFDSDWRAEGISDFLTAHDNEWVDFTLDHHPDIPGEHVRWTGRCKLRAPSVGGDARTQEVTEVTLPCEGKPVYERVVTP